MAISYANSWVEICNRALGRLGKGRIDDLVTGGDLVQYCNLFLGEAIEQVLSARHWVGWRVRVQLARSSTIPAFGWTYAYALPADLITLIEVDAAEGEYQPEGAFILTDAEQVYITYIPQPVSPVSLPGYLKKCISTQLAALLSTPLTVSGDLRGQLMQENQIALAEGYMADGLRSEVEESTPFYDEAR